MEAGFVKWLKSRVPTSDQLPLGLTDDAALLLGVDRDRCVVTTDLLADGVHFDLQTAEPARVGRKALAVNLSDLAAMAAEPVAAFVSVLLPDEQTRPLAEAIYDGMLALADEYDVHLGGGDTNVWRGRLVISVMVIGQASARGPLRRGNAQPGDAIVVTGPLGGSIESRHLDFAPRVREALYLHSHYDLHAGMDISDGLLLDLDRMIEASGCGAVLRMEEIPISEAARELSCCVPDPASAALGRALSDGEDFELLLAVAPNDAERLLADTTYGLQCAKIGEFVSQRGLWQATTAGRRLAVEARGFEHGA